MDIYSKEKYSTLNYKAIVVNNDVSQDPLNQNRIQIYIPYLQSEYSITYQEYLKDALCGQHRDIPGARLIRDPDVPLR